MVTKKYDASAGPVEKNGVGAQPEISLLTESKHHVYLYHCQLWYGSGLRVTASMVTKKYDASAGPVEKNGFGAQPAASSFRFGSQGSP